jgi:hypothetical protein
MPKAKRKSAPKKSLLKTKFFVGLTVLVLAIGYFVYRSLLTPTDINMIAQGGTGWHTQEGTKITKDGKVPPVGCYYMQVQCAQAPCDPILICDAKTATPSAVPQTSCQPRPACLDSDQKCRIADKPGMYCATPTPTPIPTPVPPTRPSPPPQKPQPTSVPVVSGISSFTVKGACGTDSYLAASVVCKDGSRKQLVTNTCTHIESAMFMALAACPSAAQEIQQVGEFR